MIERPQTKQSSLTTDSDTINATTVYVGVFKISVGWEGQAWISLLIQFSLILWYAEHVMQMLNGLPSTQIRESKYAQPHSEMKTYVTRVLLLWIVTNIFHVILWKSIDCLLVRWTGNILLFSTTVHSFGFFSDRMNLPTSSCQNEKKNLSV